MISAPDRVRIAAQIVAHPRTVARVYEGKGSEYSRQRVTEGARTLGLPLPPGPSTPCGVDSREPSPTSSKHAA